MKGDEEWASIMIDRHQAMTKNPLQLHTSISPGVNVVSARMLLVPCFNLQKEKSIILFCSKNSLSPHTLAVPTDWFVLQHAKPTVTAMSSAKMSSVMKLRITENSSPQVDDG